MAESTPRQPANHTACRCGAPSPALRLAFIAAILLVALGLFFAGVRMAGAAPTHGLGATPGVHHGLPGSDGARPPVVARQ